MLADMLGAIASKSGGEFYYEVQNVNRSIGARISGEIARRHGNYGMVDSPITVRLTGTAGQSFGVWNAGGLHMYLEGDANYHVTKGMAAGKVVIRPPRGSAFGSVDAAIIGDTCLYGAHGRQIIRSRYRRGTLRRAQFRCDRGGRRYGRPRLRIHNRRGRRRRWGDRP